MGADDGSIDIEHVGSEADSPAPASRRVGGVDPLVAPGTSDSAHEHLQP